MHYTYKDGLNYVPLLEGTHSSNTSNGKGSQLSSASRIRTSTPISSRRRNNSIRYNGNYEGDLSMFASKQSLKAPGRQLRCLELVETDSDNEYKRELERYQPLQQRAISSTSSSDPSRSQLARLLLHYCDRVLQPARRKQVTTCASRLYNSTHYRRICQVICSACAWLLWLLRLVLLRTLWRLINGSFGCWRVCFLLRNSARRLLWRLTLAKCGDVKLFALILLGTPLLFVVAFVGLWLSIYTAMRECLCNLKLVRRLRGIC